jgi:hypothetical protein
LLNNSNNNNNNNNLRHIVLLSALALRKFIIMLYYGRRIENLTTAIKSCLSTLSDGLRKIAKNSIEDSRYPCEFQTITQFQPRKNKTGYKNNSCGNRSLYALFYIQTRNIRFRVFIQDVMFTLAIYIRSEFEFRVSLLAH